MAKIVEKELKYEEVAIDSVSKMMTELFPEEERSSMEELLEISRSTNSKFNVYYVANEVCGFSFVIHKYGLIFVYYLAVNKQYQSMGYGTEIFNCIKRKEPNAILILNIEPLDEAAENYCQRVRRFNFYKKNGLNLTDFFLCHEGVEYQVLASDNSLNITNYKLLLEEISGEYKQSKLYTK